MAGGQNKFVTIILALLASYAIALLPQGLWTAMLVANLHFVPNFPWSVPVMLVVLVLVWRWLGGSGWPRHTSELRHSHLLADKIDAYTFVFMFIAGTLGIAALAGLWIVMAVTVEVPFSGVPKLSGYSPFVAYSLLGTGALVGAVLEEAGFRGYGQHILERNFKTSTAVVLCSALFAIGPHPPSHGFLLPKIFFYFLVALLLASIATSSESILPSIAVHALGLAVFFSMVWPKDSERKLVWNGESKTWLYLHIAQFVACSIAVVLMLIHGKKRHTLSR